MALGPVEDLAAGLQHGLGVERLHQCGQPPLAELDGADLGGEVALEVAWMAHVRRQHVEQVALRLAAVPEPERRDTQALVEDLRGGGVVGAVGRAADIAVVGAVDRPEGERAPHEHGREHGDVRQVAAISQIGVVHQEQVALVDVVAEIVRDRLRRPGHGADMDGDVLRLRDKLALPVDHGGGEVAAGIQDLGVGGAQHRFPHLLDDGGQPVLDDGRGDRIDLAICGLGHARSLMRSIRNSILRRRTAPAGAGGETCGARNDPLRRGPALSGRSA